MPTLEKMTSASPICFNDMRIDVRDDNLDKFITFYYYLASVSLVFVETTERDRKSVN